MVPDLCLPLALPGLRPKERFCCVCVCEIYLRVCISSRNASPKGSAWRLERPFPPSLVGPQRLTSQFSNHHAEGPHSCQLGHRAVRKHRMNRGDQEVRTQTGKDDSSRSGGLWKVTGYLASLIPFFPLNWGQGTVCNSELGTRFALLCVCVCVSLSKSLRNWSFLLAAPGRGPS